MRYIVLVENRPPNSPITSSIIHAGGSLTHGGPTLDPQDSGTPRRGLVSMSYIDAQPELDLMCADAMGGMPGKGFLAEHRAAAR